MPKKNDDETNAEDIEAQVCSVRKLSNEILALVGGHEKDQIQCKDEVLEDSDDIKHMFKQLDQLLIRSEGAAVAQVIKTKSQDIYDSHINLEEHDSTCDCPTLLGMVTFVFLCIVFIFVHVNLRTQEIKAVFATQSERHDVPEFRPRRTLSDLLSYDNTCMYYLTNNNSIDPEFEYMVTMIKDYDKIKQGYIFI